MAKREKSADIDVNIGFRIRKARQFKGLTQKDVAVQLGISFQQFYKYEQGINQISSARLAQIANILDVEPNDLFSVQEKAVSTSHSMPITAIDQRAYDIWHKLENVQSKRVVLELMQMLQAQ